MLKRSDRLGFIFTSGAFTGAYGVGFAKAAVERGLMPRYVQGISVGAFNAAAFVDVQGTEIMEQGWGEIERRGPSSIFNIRKTKIVGKVLRLDDHLLGNEGLLWLTKFINADRILQSPITLDIAVFNELTRQAEFFSNRDSRFQKLPIYLKKVIIASASISGIFPAVTMGGVPYSDGEIFDLQRAFNHGCDTVLLFLNDAEEHSFGSLNRFWLKINAAKHFVKEKLIDSELRNYGSKVIVFRVSKRILSSMHFRKGDITAAIDRAYHDGQRILNSVTIID